jgi:hypothetical protein
METLIRNSTTKSNAIAVEVDGLQFFNGKK